MLKGSYNGDPLARPIATLHGTEICGSRKLICEEEVLYVVPSITIAHALASVRSDEHHAPWRAAFFRCSLRLPVIGLRKP